MIQYKANKDDYKRLVSLYPLKIGLYVSKAWKGTWGEIINVLKDLRVCFKKIFFHEFYRLLVLILASKRFHVSLRIVPDQGNQISLW